MYLYHLTKFLQMKKIFFLSCFSLLNIALYAQHEGHNHDKPVATADIKTAAVVKPVEHTLVVKEEVYDFGKIPQGKPVHHTFEVQNTGNSALKIGNVQASCGCTTPEWEKDKDIPAGQSSNIKVGYNAAAEGPFTKLITITYNENQTRQITIKGEVWKTPAASAPANEAVNELKN